jgi:hypothetical protein
MRKYFKGFITGILISSILLLSITIFGETIETILNGVNITINGVRVAESGENYTLSNGSEVPNSILYNGTTYLPIRKISELLEKNITWDGITKTITIYDSESDSIRLNDDVKNNESLTFDINDLNLSFNINQVVQDANSLRIYTSCKNNSNKYGVVFGNSLYVYIDDIEYRMQKDMLFDISANEEKDVLIYFEPINNVSKIDLRAYNSWDIHKKNILAEVKNLIVDNNQNDTTIYTEPLNINPLDNHEELLKILEDNFSVLKTEIGETEFVFEIYKNNSEKIDYDYKIEVSYDLTFFMRVEDSLEYSIEMREKSKNQLKDFQEKIARTCIVAFPHSKLKGSYFRDGYRYDAIKEGYFTIEYFSWQNYTYKLNYNIHDDAYYKTELSCFRWTSDRDDGLKIEGIE